MSASRRTPRRRNASSPHRRPAAIQWPDASWRWGEDGALVLTLPVPGSGNRQWRQGRGRRPRKNELARAYEDGARWSMSSCPKLAGEVTVDVVWFRERRSGDVDNRLKPLLDAIKDVAFGDDASVRRASIERVDSREVAACMVVTIRPA